MLKRVLPFFPLLVILAFGACTGTPDVTLRPDAVTLVIQSMTAAVWTPTVTPTIEPDSPKIVNILNGGMIASDPLEETVAAKFDVLDVRFPVDQVSQQILVMQIDVECEWIFTDSCTSEESFVNLMHGFVAGDKVIEKIRAQVPATVKNVYITTFNHMVRNGIIVVSWQDVVAFATGRINGNQLGSRINRMGH